MENSASFQLSFYSYDNFTAIPNSLISESSNLTTSERELRFSHDHLTDRLMLKEMGKGVRDVKLEFVNPIVVSQRLDEGMVMPENFTNPKKAFEEYYPDGAYGYSPVMPMIVKFERPL